jgi:sugar lactone lactonase YvrE
MTASSQPLTLLAILLCASILVTACGSDTPADDQTEPASPLAEDATVERIAGGFQFTEGPYWRPDSSDLIFSDIPANRVYRWAPGDTTASVFLEPSGHSNGINADNEGRILLAQHDGHVARLTESGETEILVSEYEGQRLNSPNDLDVHSSGAIYFTDPPYGVDEEERELDFSGVYRLDPDGSLTLLTREFARPNGIVLSPDESRLYVNDSQENIVRVYDVADDGSLSNGRLFAEPQDPGADGATDGMKVDVEGNLYTTGPGGVWIYNPDGELIDRLSVPESSTNLAFGGSDMTTLYITAPPNVYRAPVTIAGVQ